MPSGLIALPRVGTVQPVTFQAVSSAFSNTQSFGGGVSASTTFDISAYSALPNLALVVALNWYANGGGLISFASTWNGAALSMMVGQDRSAGANYGAQLWILQNPAIGNFTLAASQSGGSNTGRNIWAMAWLYSNVSGYDNAAAAALASGVAQTIVVGPNQAAVNAMSAGQTMSNYSQTQRQASTVGNTLRGLAGDATGDSSGSKDFSTTGGNYNSAVARLLPTYAAA